MAPHLSLARILLFVLAVRLSPSEISAVAQPGDQVDCPSQANATIKLLITNQKAQPLRGARVQFTAPAWDSTIIVEADSSGIALIPCIPKGSGYFATLSLEGYERRKLRINARNSGITRVSAVLKSRRAG